jgi:hypothetical protein
MNSLEKVLANCSHIESTLKHATAGIDVQRLREIEKLCSEMTANSDPYISRNASSLASKARQFFGPRRDVTATDEGATRLLNEMRLSLLRALREQATLKLREQKP